MDPNFRSRTSSFTFIEANRDYNKRRSNSNSSSPEYYPIHLSRSRLNNANLAIRPSQSISRNGYFEDYNIFQYYVRKAKQHSTNYDLSSSHRNFCWKMDSSYKSFDTCLMDAVMNTKRMKYMHKNSKTAEKHSSDPKNTKHGKSCEKSSLEETNFKNKSVKHSKKSRCHRHKHFQQLEKDLKLHLVHKSVKNDIKLKLTQKSKPYNSICSKIKQQNENAKSYCEVPPDTLILCIDEDEASDILFGDLKRTLEKKMNIN